MVIGISGYCLWWLIYQDTLWWLVYQDTVHGSITLEVSWYTNHHRQYPDIPITLEVSWYSMVIGISGYCLWWLIYQDTVYGDWYIRILYMVIGISGYCLWWLIHQDTLWWLIYQDTVYGDWYIRIWYINHHRQYPDIPITIDSILIYQSP
jgi:hypothetical protein